MTGYRHPSYKRCRFVHQFNHGELLMYSELSFKITGVAPLILHNGQTADPLNPHSQSMKAITNKRKKVDADHIELAKREWYAGLYTSNNEVVIPFQMVEATLINGAKKEKRGPDAKAGIVVEKHTKLVHGGPANIDDLWKDEKYRIRVPVKVGTNKVMRTRPYFENWSATLVIKYLEAILNSQDIKSFLITAGMIIGFGDWRPRFGRFALIE